MLVKPGQLGAARDRIVPTEVPRCTSDCVDMPILSVMGAVNSVLRMAVQTRRLTLAHPMVIEDPFRGLHLSGEDITAELDGAAAMPLVNRQGGLVDWMQAAAAHPPLAAMIAAYGLAPVEVGALLLGLARKSTVDTTGFLPFSMMT